MAGDEYIELTVHVTTVTDRAITELVDAEDLHASDILNRAIQLYAELVEIRAAGGAIFISESGDPEEDLTQLRWE